MKRKNRAWILVAAGSCSVSLLMTLSGCGTMVNTAPSGPAGVPPPVGEGVSAPAPAPPRTDDPSRERAAFPRPAAAPLDPILDSPWAASEGMAEAVGFWLESLQTDEAELLRASLARMGRYEEMVERELAARRLPPSLAYLPIVESWYNPTAVSWVGAVGLWQFMAPTARGLGLQVTRLVDERRDPYRATPLALDFLADLYDRFGSWFLALAAYNGGPGRLNRIMQRRAPGEEGHDGLFLEIRGDLPRETRNFVPRFIAAALIARDPAAFGFADVAAEPHLEFDEVVVPDAASLDVVAAAAGVDQGTVEALNPQLLRGLTPAGVSTPIRLPVGKGSEFMSAFARIPPEERVTFLEHVVSSGETLSHIAVRHGVTIADLRAANPRIQPRLLQIGQRVVVPKAPSARQALRGVAISPASTEGPLVYRVRAGDTLSAIAARHRVRVGDLLRWNGLSLEAIIRPGDEVKIYPGGGSS